MLWQQLKQNSQVVWLGFTKSGFPDYIELWPFWRATCTMTEVQKHITDVHGVGTYVGLLAGFPITEYNGTMLLTEVLRQAHSQPFTRLPEPCAYMIVLQLSADFALNRVSL